jgi:hypothetical protein
MVCLVNFWSLYTTPKDIIVWGGRRWVNHTFRIEQLMLTARCRTAMPSLRERYSLVAVSTPTSVASSGLVVQILVILVASLSLKDTWRSKLTFSILFTVARYNGSLHRVASPFVLHVQHRRWGSDHLILCQRPCANVLVVSRCVPIRGSEPVSIPCAPEQTVHVSSCGRSLVFTTSFLA